MTIAGKHDPGSMNEKLRVLILEDVESDGALMEMELHRAGFVFQSRRVATREEFVEQLSDFGPDVILADFSLPGFDGLSALSIVQARCPDLPFIFVSGAIGEERAIQTLREGATDYVLKDHLSGLPLALKRALRECEERMERERAEAALQRSEKRHRLLLEVNNAIISNLERDSLFDAIARALLDIVPFDSASLRLADSRRHLVEIYTRTGSPTAPRVTSKSLPCRDPRDLEGMLDDREPVVRDDLLKIGHGSTSREVQLLEEGMRAHLAVPLVVKDRLVGHLEVSSRCPGRYSEEDVGLMSEVGKQVGLAIENLLAYEEISFLKSRLEQENAYLQEEIEAQHGSREMIGESPAISNIMKAIETVAATDATVLICGETGTGKELVARAVHDSSPQRDKPLVKVNCAALPATLVESELFGHEKGAFTGAVARKIGRFELADGGTIFLDEVGELAPELQVKLLRVLQEEEFERVGGSTTIKVQVRVIAATNRDLEKAMREEQFRPDLYYRLAVFPIELPPLRERREDIPILANSFVSSFGRKLGKSLRISNDVMARLSAYSWPGNIRELRNVIERAAIVSTGPELSLDDRWPKAAVSSSPPPVLTLDSLQRNHILSVLELTGGQVSGEKGAAKLLGIKPTTLTARMKKLGIQRVHNGRRYSDWGIPES